MKEILFSTLSELSVLSAPSTREMPVQRWLEANLRGIGLNPSGDAQGNLWCGDGSEGGIKCGIVAHADEIGIQLVSIDEPGIGRFRKIGGLRATSLIGQPVVFVNRRGEQVAGVVGCDPMQNNGTENGILVKTSDLWVDIGAESAEEFGRNLEIGDFATFRPYPLTRFGENRVVGKALDDRCGIAVAYESFFQLTGKTPGIEPFVVSTVQEELNLFGAKAMPLDLDVAVVVDVDFASDTPSSLADVTPLSLGRGIGICINADNNPMLLRSLTEACGERNIPVQPTVGRSFSGGTDSAALRLKRACATVNISIPLRYMHTSAEMLDLRDLGYAVQAVTALFEKLSKLKNLEELVPWKN